MRTLGDGVDADEGEGAFEAVPDAETVDDGVDPVCHGAIGVVSVALCDEAAFVSVVDVVVLGTDEESELLEAANPARQLTFGRVSEAVDEVAEGSEEDGERQPDGGAHVQKGGCERDGDDGGVFDVLEVAEEQHLRRLGVVELVVAGERSDEFVLRVDRHVAVLCPVIGA